jgi:hypothetical protein
MEQALFEERTRDVTGTASGSEHPQSVYGAARPLPFGLPEACVVEWEITDVSGRVIQLLRSAYRGGREYRKF